MGTGILITLGTMMGLGMLILIIVLIATRGASSATVTTTAAAVSESTSQMGDAETRIKNDELVASTGLKVLCFFVPIVGLLIYACNISFNRKFATDCGKWALISYLIRVGLVVVILLLTLIITIINMSATIII